jgi:hypothetical protein
MANIHHIQIIQGIPYWISSDNQVYLFNNLSRPDLELAIGNYNPALKQVVLNGKWKQTAESALNTYRSTIQSIPRSDYTKIQKFSKKQRTTRQNAGNSGKKKSSPQTDQVNT